MLKGRALFAEVEGFTGQAFWWLGQHSFIVKLGSTICLIDPFLGAMPERNVPPLFAAKDATAVQVVCCTHDHLDHICPAAVSGLARETEAAFVAPEAHEQRMLSLGVPESRLILLNDEDVAQLGDLKVTAIKASHEFFDMTPEGDYPYLSYVLEAAGKTVYHAGDTVWWEGMQARLARWHYDVAFVPINGRDAKRYQAGIIGNMTYQEAVDLLGGLDVKLNVPSHYDMFDGNREDPQKFVDYMNAKYPGRRIWVGKPTERVEF
jgi:L-ascorbate metabolism protein UlaG (beta-lactamase superfamily)